MAAPCSCWKCQRQWQESHLPWQQCPRAPSTTPGSFRHRSLARRGSSRAASAPSSRTPAAGWAVRGQDGAAQGSQHLAPGPGLCLHPMQEGLANLSCGNRGAAPTSLRPQLGGCLGTGINPANKTQGTVTHPDPFNRAATMARGGWRREEQEQRSRKY